MLKMLKGTDCQTPYYKPKSLLHLDLTPARTFPKIKLTLSTGSLECIPPFTGPETKYSQKQSMKRNFYTAKLNSTDKYVGSFMHFT